MPVSRKMKLEKGQGQADPEYVQLKYANTKKVAYNGFLSL